MFAFERDNSAGARHVFATMGAVGFSAKAQKAWVFRSNFEQPVSTPNACTKCANNAAADSFA